MANAVEAMPAVETISTTTVHKIIPFAQNYDWGRVADKSEVAQLLLANGQDIDATKPFAELWMGTHPSGPAKLAEGPLADTELLAYIRDHPEVLGTAIETFGADLPFLLKVLSVKTALSIQSHPDKALAEKLNAERPNVYKDGNHKPEMALALSDFQALCGFAPHEELVEAFNTVPELRECCSIEAVDAYISSTEEDRKDKLRDVFTVLMTADPTAVKAAVEALHRRLTTEKETRDLSPKESLVLTLHEQYPGDVGVLAAWFLNYVTLEEGHAIALPANEPHAYVAGEIVECMATSDNVIRAGLTPKLRDTDVLCSSLTYNQGKPDVLTGEESLDGHLKLYRPAFKEFEVWKFSASKGETVSLPAAKGPLVMLVQHGTGSVLSSEQKTPIKRGDVLFVPANAAVEVNAEEDVVVWFAAANSLGF